MICSKCPHFDLYTSYLGDKGKCRKLRQRVSGEDECVYERVHNLWCGSPYEAVPNFIRISEITGRAMPTMPKKQSAKKTNEHCLRPVRAIFPDGTYKDYKGVSEGQRDQKTTRNSIRNSAIDKRPVNGIQWIYLDTVEEYVV